MTLTSNGLEYPQELLFRPVDKVVSLWDSGKLDVSDWQREDTVWNSRQIQIFVKSTIKGKKIPVTDSQRYSADDIRLTNGQQRNINLIRFRKGKIRIEKPKPTTSKYKKDKDYYSKYGGKTFSKLPRELQNRLKTQSVPFYEAICEDETEERDYFVLVNTLGSNLNRPEINKAYFNDTAFWKLARILSKKYKKFYQQFAVLTDRQLGRSLDQLTTEELLVLMHQGAQSSSKLSSYYHAWDLNVPNKADLTDELEKVFNYIKRVYPQGLARTRFSNPNNFYALVGAVHSKIKHGRLKSPKTVNNNLTRFMASVYNGKTATDSKRYWDTLQEGTKSKQHRKHRIEILCKKI